MKYVEKYIRPKSNTLSENKFGIRPARPVHSNIGETPGLGQYNTYRDYGKHAGMDYMAGLGTPVFAILDGVVERASFRPLKKGGKSSYGYVIVLYHGERASTGRHIYSLYAHLEEGSFKTLAPGDKVEKGQQIAKSGNTHKAKIHLHFEVKESPEKITWITTGREMGVDYGQYKVDPKQFLEERFIRKPDPLENQEPEREVTEADRKKFAERLRIKRERDRWGNPVPDTVWVGSKYAGRLDSNTGEIKLDIPSDEFFALIDGPKPMQRAGDAKFNVKVDV